MWVAKSCLSINATEKREARTVSKYVIVLVSERSTRRICVSDIRAENDSINDCVALCFVSTRPRAVKNTRFHVKMLTFSGYLIHGRYPSFVGRLW